MVLCFANKTIKYQKSLPQKIKKIIFDFIFPSMNKNLQENICEEKLFSSIFMKYSKSLHDFLYYKYGNHLNPEDKVQEAFIKLWDNCKDVSIDKAKSFLFTVANFAATGAPSE